MKHRADIAIPGSTYECSLVKLIGKQIADVRGYVTSPYGGDPIWKLTRIEFADGTFLDIEGEHDMPYCAEDRTQPNFGLATLRRLYKEDTQ